MVAIVAIALVAMRATQARNDKKFEPLFSAPAFELIDQNGKPFGTADLRGKVWIADFIFINCGGPCPIMTSKLADVQNKVSRMDVKLVSFSVDPERDTSRALKEYAARFNADESRWAFLTGDKTKIYQIAADMKITAQPATADSPILHSELFLLVDRKGNVVGIYHSNDEADMSKLVADAAELADRK